MRNFLGILMIPLFFFGCASWRSEPSWAHVTGTDKYGVWADLKVDGVTQRFRWIAPGTFMMGSPENEDGSGVRGFENQHQVTISKGYWLADTECTQAMWQAITGKNPSFEQNLQNPVEQISWNDCQKFLAFLNTKCRTSVFRFPTEAEWEYACRAGTTTPFSFGTTITSDQVNYNGEFPYKDTLGGFDLFRKKTIPVKSLPVNAWGLYEMHGNVAEWCCDRYGSYSNESVTDPIGQSEECIFFYRMIRGGSWDSEARSCRSGVRGSSHPDESIFIVGFRLCASTQ